MSETVALIVGGDADAAAELATWLDADDELRGRVRRDPGQVAYGALGPDLPQLAVSLGSGGVATAMASVLIAWLRRRTGTVSLRVSRSDGSAVELHAEHVRGLDAAALRAQVDQLADAVWPHDDIEEPAELSDGRAGGE